MFVLILCYKGPCTFRSKQSYYVGLLGACFVHWSFWWVYVTKYRGYMITLQRQNAKNLKQIFPEKEYRGLSPNIHIHVSACVANYIFPRWVCLFCWRKYVDQSLEYINRSQTHECGNWGWGRAIPRKGYMTVLLLQCKIASKGRKKRMTVIEWMIEHEK